MNCPNCGHEINPAAVLGAKGGKTKGAASKARPVDYAALAAKSHAARRINRVEREDEIGPADMEILRELSALPTLDAYAAAKERFGKRGIDWLVWYQATTGSNRRA